MHLAFAWSAIFTILKMKFSETSVSILALCALITPASNAFIVKAPYATTSTKPQASWSSIAATRVAQNDNGVISHAGVSSISYTPRAAPIFVPAPALDSQLVTVGQSPDVSPFTNPRTTEEVFAEITPRQIQGGSLRVCHFSELVERVSVYLKTSGRPLNANVELWHGPDHTPQKMSVYLEDGNIHPFRIVVESPGSSNTVAIRNTGSLEYPLIAGLEVDMSGKGVSPSKILLEHPKNENRSIQGGAIYTKPFQPVVQSVQLALKSDGRPINARIELLQGPNNNKSVMELYSEDGLERPFYLIIDTPGNGNVVRIVNMSTMEFPMTAAIEPYLVDDDITTGSLNWD